MELSPPFAEMICRYKIVWYERVLAFSSNVPEKLCRSLQFSIRIFYRRDRVLHCGEQDPLPFFSLLIFREMGVVG
jgi:hypothetical protein